METTGKLSQLDPRGTPPVLQPNHAVLPTRKRTTDSAIDSLLYSSPDSLDRCIVLNDLSSVGSPASNSLCRTPPPIIDSVTPLSDDSSCKSAAEDVITDVQETPLSVRSGRKRKHHKRRLRRSALPCSPLVEPAINSYNSGTVTPHHGRYPYGVAVKTEPKMPKLLPEPRVRYNPDTPLRISIHLPLNGVLNSAEDGLLSEKVERLPASHCSGGDLPNCNPVSNSEMPVDLTSRASVQMPQPSLASSASSMKHFNVSVSSTLPSVGPTYSPISSMSGRSTPDDRQEDLSCCRQEVLQPSVGKMASFLNQFSGVPPESLQFSPSQSFWTRSFAEQLAEFNQNGFVAGYSLTAPLMSPVTASDRCFSEVNTQKSVDLSFHPSHIPTPKSVVNERQNAEIRDCVAVRPTVVADNGAHRVDISDLSDDGEHSKYNVNTKTPLQLTNGETYSSIEAVRLTDILGSHADVLPGTVYFIEF